MVGKIKIGRIVCRKHPRQVLRHDVLDGIGHVVSPCPQCMDIEYAKGYDAGADHEEHIRALKGGAGGDQVGRRGRRGVR